MEKEAKDVVGGTHTKYTIAVSGAAETGHCSDKAFDATVKLGQEIAKRGMILLTGATHGAPFWAAKACKEAGGTVIGFSPAATRLHHIKSYRLPVDYHDFIIYTGFDYSGRNLMLTRAADGVVSVCGRIGTLNEFTIAFEDRKPQGILTGTGGVSDMIADIVTASHRGKGKLAFDDDPAALLDKLIGLIEDDNSLVGAIVGSEVGHSNDVA